MSHQRKKAAIQDLMAASVVMENRNNCNELPIAWYYYNFFYTVPTYKPLIFDYLVNSLWSWVFLRSSVEPNGKICILYDL